MRARTTDAVYYGALAVSFVLGVATLWSVDYLPTNDGPQHIFLGHAENLYGDSTTIYRSQFVPQLQFAARGFALWFDPLEPLLGFRDATRVVLSLFYSWIFGGYVLLVHALGPSRRWLALLGCAVPLCWPLYMGLFPYYSGLGIGLLLLGYVARRAVFDRRAAMVVGAGLALQYVHHAFSAVPTILCLAILVAVRCERAERRATLVRFATALVPAAIGLVALAWFRPPASAGPVELHWEPMARRALILPRVLFSGSAPTRWVGSTLLGGALVASVVRFRRVERTERAYIVCAWASALFLLALPIVIPGWQFFNVRFAPFVVVFALPLLPLERLKSETRERALCAIAAAGLLVPAFGFHRSLRASCADDLAGLSVPVARVGYRFPVALEPFCELPRDATQSPVPFLGPARNMGALYAAAQGGTVPNAFANAPAIHPFLARRGEDAPRVPIPDEATLRFGEEVERLANAPARKHMLQTVSILAQSYDDVLVFGATDADVTTLGELGFRTAFRQRRFAMMELEGCKTEVVIEGVASASAITVAGGVGGRNEITWERRAKPQDGEIVVPVSQRLCGPGWIRVRYDIGNAAFACSGTPDGKLPYDAKRGEVTRVRCNAPEK
jgi:hypothetical protein